MDFSWLHATHREVRELGWSLFSPNLLALAVPADRETWAPAWDEESRHLLAALDRNPAPLRHFLSAQRDLRLGARFEALWAFYLEHHSFYRLLSRNFQVTANRKTLGSLDFVFEDHFSHQVVHLELAVKLYLHFPTGPATAMASWIGPNPDDSLAIKYRHLRHHQLPLSDTTEARAQLREKGLPIPDIRCAIVKGWLFSANHGQPVLPAPVNGRCPKGVWYRATHLAALRKDFPSTRWRELPRDYWLDPLPTGGARPLAEDWLESVREPVLLAGQDGGNGETEQGMAARCFLVPASWPDHMHRESWNGDPEGT